ncbi:haloacid dehalogenase-like hydrolase [Niveibacterium sp. SC-1]|uniref:HAD family hydrolase n=1 Tax=Niveibacterium sp. SC-1 TaxID=3135646 RepID=UPI00311E70E7
MGERSAALLATRSSLWARRVVLNGLALLALCLALPTPAAADVPRVLPSWRDGPTREAILHFIDNASDPASLDFIPAVERVAVFDHDGTLCPEQPLYLQLAYAIDRVRTMAAENPQWQTRQPFKAVLEGDTDALLDNGPTGWSGLMSETHAGMTVEQFSSKATDWLAVARDPRFSRPYTELAYQPMRELMDYLRAKGFRVYIVSAGSIEFLRVLSESMYGVPREQVIGPTADLDFVLTEDGRAELVRRKGLRYEVGPGVKAATIYKAIGRRPVMVVGNADADLAMLQWVGSSLGPHLSLLVHHTDAVREWAYDRDTKVGRLDRALLEAGLRAWPVVDIARDWSRVFAFEPLPADPAAQ